VTAGRETGPVMFLESRTSTWGWLCAISTQSEPPPWLKLLFRQAISTQSPSEVLLKLLFLHLSIQFASRSVVVACQAGKELPRLSLVSGQCCELGREIPVRGKEGVHIEEQRSDPALKVDQRRCSLNIEHSK